MADTKEQSNDEFEKITHFLYEVGSLRRIPRSHRQTLMVNDNADNIASHTYRVAMIGWFLAKLEGTDPYKVVTMCLIHDLGEVRAGDQNWLHKRYVKVFEEEIRKDQLGSLPFQDLKEFADEYSERQSKESIVAKDADLLDQVLLLKEYEHQGNKEATLWLYGKNDDEDHNKQLMMLKTESAKKIGEKILQLPPSD